MSMDVGGTKGGVKSDINVTPLVDVMLVLLIIMMIVAPLLQKGADVRLPLAANTMEKPETQDQTVVAVDKSDRYFVNGLPVRKEDIRTKVEEILETKKERIILIKADQDAKYAAVMDLMDELRASGIEDMGLITDPKNRASLLSGGGGN
jgi:biopolymer transport protein TolR